ncbi:Ig-like domain-containing protein [Mycobacterium sp. C31M]
MHLRYGRYVGRIGALAVALGIGSAVAAPAGVVSAAPEDTTATSSESTRDTDTDTETATDTVGSEPADADESDTVAPTDPVDTEDDESAPDTAAAPDDGELGPENEPAPTRKRKARTVRTAGPDALRHEAPPAATYTSARIDEAIAPPDTPVAAVAPTQQPVIDIPAASAKPVVANPIQAVGALFAAAVRPLLTSLLGVLDDWSAQSPLAWALVAAARRQLGLPEPDGSQVRAATVAAANQPPTATVVWGRPDATTGTVVGKLLATDPEGKKVAVTVTGNAIPGTFAYNAKSAVITYTPTTAQRFAASASATPEDTVTITLRVTDGVTAVDVPTHIPVSPSPFFFAGNLIADDPSALTVVGTRAYVTDRATGTVAVYDTVKNTLLTTYQAGLVNPDGITAKRDGTRLYVSSSTGNKVTVIDAKTGVLKGTLTIANPTAITINPSGSTVYVANGAAGTVTKISTWNNKTAGTVRLSAGMTPTELTVSADGKRIFVAGANGSGGELAMFGSSASVATRLADTGSAPTGLVFSQALQRAYVTDAAGNLTVYDTVTKIAGVVPIGQPLSGLAITNDGSAVLVTTGSGMVAALGTADGAILGVAGIGTTTAHPALTVSPDGTQLLVTDPVSGTVRVISLVPPNIAPFSNDPVYQVSNPATGALTGKVGVVDFDGDPLTHVLTVKPTKGKLTLNADGTYVYTPTAAARHAAAKAGAAAATDTFTVLVSDGRNGTLAQTITVTIAPANKVPTVTTAVGNPSGSAGVVKGAIKTADGDGDKRTVAVSALPARGTVTLASNGAFTYTPTPDARAAALAPGASYAARMDSFTVTVDDGFGGVVPVTVNVRIGAANVKPVWATPVTGIPNSRSGLIDGVFTATDGNGDPVSYTAGKTTKGTITINADGTFSYTPTAAARAAASKKGASAATKSETVSITVRDGFGGTTTASVKLAIAPNPLTNSAPTNGHDTQQDSSAAIGTVTGTVHADDADGDTLTYTLKTGPAHGVVTLSRTGAFTYTPTVEARYRALITDDEDTDTFTVTVADNFGGTTTATVAVAIAPPAPAAIDQRATTVAVNTQQMYFYSQADTDKALGLLKDAGVDTIRIMLPWAGAEPQNDSYDWGAVDRMVDSAKAHGIKVLATINSTPDWAAVPGQPPYAGAPADVVAFGEFVSAVASGYQGRIADYEIWNEPNYNGFWAPTPDAATYTALLRIAYTAIKNADPDATVIGGSVAAVAEGPGGPGVNPVTYLSQMYAAGAAGYFDALAFHPYLYSVPFSVQQGHAGVPFTQAQQLYAVMVANGDGHKKIWATEYGQPASEGGEATQAAYVGDFLRAWRTLEFAGPAFIHTIADYPHDYPDQATMGLFRADWTPKPVVAVVAQVIAENTAINAV